MQTNFVVFLARAVDLWCMTCNGRENLFASRVNCQLKKHLKIDKNFQGIDYKFRKCSKGLRLKFAAFSKYSLFKFQENAYFSLFLDVVNCIRRYLTFGNTFPLCTKEEKWNVKNAFLQRKSYFKIRGFKSSLKDWNFLLLKFRLKLSFTKISKLRGVINLYLKLFFYGYYLQKKEPLSDINLSENRIYRYFINENFCYFYEFARVFKENFIPDIFGKYVVKIQIFSHKKLQSVNFDTTVFKLKLLQLSYGVRMFLK